MSTRLVGPAAAAATAAATSSALVRGLQQCGAAECLRVAQAVCAVLARPPDAAAAAALPVAVARALEAEFAAPDAPIARKLLVLEALAVASVLLASEKPTRTGARVRSVTADAARALVDELRTRLGRMLAHVWKRVRDNAQLSADVVALVQRIAVVVGAVHVRAACATAHMPLPAALAGADDDGVAGGLLDEPAGVDRARAAFVGVLLGDSAGAKNAQTPAVGSPSVASAKRRPPLADAAVKRVHLRPASPGRGVGAISTKRVAGSVDASEVAVAPSAPAPQSFFSDTSMSRYANVSFRKGAPNSASSCLSAHGTASGARSMTAQAAGAPERRKCAMAMLPHDVLALVLSFTDALTRLRCRAVCKLWHALLTDHPLLTTELALGLSSSLRAAVPDAGRMLMLREDSHDGLSLPLSLSLPLPLSGPSESQATPVGDKRHACVPAADAYHAPRILQVARDALVQVSRQASSLAGLGADSRSSSGRVDALALAGMLANRWTERAPHVWAATSHWRHLRRVDLGYCGTVDDALVSQLCQRLERSVRSLSLAGCALVRDRGLGALAGTCGFLEELDVSHLMVSADAFRRLTHSLARADRLRRLVMRGCGGLGASALRDALVIRSLRSVDCSCCHLPVDALTRAPEHRALLCLDVSCTCKAMMPRVSSLQLSRILEHFPALRCFGVRNGDDLARRDARERDVQLHWSQRVLEAVSTGRVALVRQLIGAPHDVDPLADPQDVAVALAHSTERPCEECGRGLGVAHPRNAFAWRDADGGTILHRGVSNTEDRRMTEWLLGVDACRQLINVPNLVGRTPLHAACEGGHVGALRALLQAGASTTIRDVRGQLASSLASGMAVLSALQEFGYTPATEAEAAMMRAAKVIERVSAGLRQSDGRMTNQVAQLFRQQFFELLRVISGSYRTAEEQQYGRLVATAQRTLAKICDRQYALVQGILSGRRTLAPDELRLIERVLGDDRMLTIVVRLMSNRDHSQRLLADVAAYGFGMQL